MFSGGRDKWQVPNILIPYVTNGLVNKLDINFCSRQKLESLEDQLYVILEFPLQGLGWLYRSRWEGILFLLYEFCNLCLFCMKLKYMICPKI